jgi:hypothetical protein
MLGELGGSWEVLGILGKSWEVLGRCLGDPGVLGVLDVSDEFGVEVDLVEMRRVWSLWEGIESSGSIQWDNECGGWIAWWGGVGRERLRR